jgi:hypothetical protein
MLSELVIRVTFDHKTSKQHLYLDHDEQGGAQLPHCIGWSRRTFLFKN